MPSAYHAPGTHAPRRRGDDEPNLFLEFAGGEIEPLGDIVRLVRDRVSIIDPDSAERRVPDQAGADRCAQLAICCEGKATPAK